MHSSLDIYICIYYIYAELCRSVHIFGAIGYLHHIPYSKRDSLMARTSADSDQERKMERTRNRPGIFAPLMRPRGYFFSTVDFAQKNWINGDQRLDFGKSGSMICPSSKAPQGTFPARHLESAQSSTKACHLRSLPLAQHAWDNLATSYPLYHMISMIQNCLVGPLMQ